MSEWVGKTKYATFLVVDSTGAPAASNVTWTITRPDATTITPSVSNPELGTYTAQWTWDQVGVWQLLVGADSPISVSDAATFIVSATEPPEITVNEACAPWTTIRDVRMNCSSIATTATASDEIVGQAIGTATDLLYVLSGRQFSGECSTTVRPCGDSNCFSYYSRGGLYLSLTNFPNPPDPSSYLPRQCGCARIPTVDLGYWPVRSIDQVKIDGAVVDPSTYRLDQNRYLVRLADPAQDYDNPGWPRCQDLDRQATEPDTFEVSFTYGIKPPPAGVAAANHLACELARMVATGVCNIPGRATSVNRQQISFTMINASMLENGLTGLWDVDAFIIAYNPDRRRGTTVVWTPDLPKGSYRTGP